MPKNVLFFIFLVAFAAAAVAVLFSFSRGGANDPTEREEIAEHPLIRAFLPRPGDAISSPLIITGEARGHWYFEATFPVELVDENGSMVAGHYAQAEGEWMTTDFVPFRAELFFASPPPFPGEPAGALRRGTLILHKSNASGLPEHDDSIEIPVVF